MSKTGFDKYLEEKMKDPTFATGYETARAEIDMPDIVKDMIEPGKSLKVLCRFRVAYIAWECDSEGFIVEDENKERHVILTNHGSPYFAKREELIKRLDAYRSWITETTTALDCLDNWSDSELK